MTPIPIIALDVADRRAAMMIVSRLGETCRFYKVGSELFTREGPSIVREVRGEGCDVFLDLKYHDIPTTVERAVAAAAALGARLVTVHASGGEAMLSSAVSAAGSACGVLAVTVLTSMDAAALAAASGRPGTDLQAEVLRLAALASSAGAHGVVCSGAEAPAVRASHGDALRVLVPGIRLKGAEAHDQARVVTPAEAAAAGASYIVLGRAVTQAENPVAAMREVLAALA